MIPVMQMLFPFSHSVGQFPPRERDRVIDSSADARFRWDENVVETKGKNISDSERSDRQMAVGRRFERD